MIIDDTGFPKKGNFFAKIKQSRAIATRYDKTARNFLGAAHAAKDLAELTAGASSAGQA